MRQTGRQVFLAQIPIRMRIDMRIRHGNAIRERSAPGTLEGAYNFFFLLLPPATVGRDRHGGRVERWELSCGKGVGNFGPNYGHGRCLSPRCRSCFIRGALGHSSSIADKFIPVRVGESSLDPFFLFFIYRSSSLSVGLGKFPDASSRDRKPSRYPRVAPAIILEELCTLRPSKLDRNERTLRPTNSSVDLPRDVTAIRRLIAHVMSSSLTGECLKMNAAERSDCNLMD